MVSCREHPQIKGVLNQIEVTDLYTKRQQQDDKNMHYQRFCETGDSVCWHPTWVDIYTIANIANVPKLRAIVAAKHDDTIWGGDFFAMTLQFLARSSFTQHFEVHEWHRLPKCDAILH